jgi:ribonuclease HI
LSSASPATPSIDIFTDGACSGNPGPGGWAYILRHAGTGKEKEAFGAEETTTNNRMELQAAIAALEALKRPSKVRLPTDSSYLKDGITKWLPQWKAPGMEDSRQEAGQECRPLAAAGSSRGAS